MGEQWSVKEIFLKVKVIFWDKSLMISFSKEKVSRESSDSGTFEDLMGARLVSPGWTVVSERNKIKKRFGVLVPWC